MKKDVIEGYAGQVARHILSKHELEIAEQLQSSISSGDIIDMPGKLAAETIRQSVKLSVEAVLFALTDQHIIGIEESYTPHITLVPPADQQKSPE